MPQEERKYFKESDGWEKNIVHDRGRLKNYTSNAEEHYKNWKKTSNVNLKKTKSVTK